MIFSIVIFGLVYIVISTDIFNKTVAVLIGSVIFIFSGILSEIKAFHNIDWNVIFMLISMMIIVGIIKRTGLFQYVAIKAAKFAKGNPVTIIVLLSIITASFSAILDNVTTIMIIVPVSILIAVELGVNPIPFVIAEAISSNIGGTATLIGDPPNIMIGSAAGLTFNDFLINLSPAIIIIMTLISFIMYVYFKKKIEVTNERKARIMEFNENRSITDYPLLIKSLIILGLVIAGFLTHNLFHVEPATISLGGASILMLLVGKKEVDKFFHEVEWETIFFFIGLFIMVGALVETGAIKMLATWLLKITNNDIKITSIMMVWISGIFSAFVDNIPYVATMIPLVQDISDKLGKEAVMPIWWALSLGACLGGNGTLVGASANVVSAGLCSKSGYKLSFLEFTKYGLIVTFISLSISTVYIYVRYLL